jgi:glucan 1,3-beta-glucosidase
VTEQDIKTLADSGLTHVRIPVGYWILGARDDEPFVDGSMFYLKRGLEWLRKYKMKALIDLHCAPGSQNGFDNSGRKGDIHWEDQDVDGSFPNVDRTVEALRQLATMFGAPEWQDVVTGLEPVNEPFLTLSPDVVRRFYKDAYKAIRAAAGPNLAIFFSDSFRFSDFKNVMLTPPYENVFLDTHIYQVFDVYRLGFTEEQHIHQTCTINKPEVQTSPMRTIVGEWSLAITDCAQWLNGYGAGARYEGKFADAPVMGSCDGRDNIYSPIFTEDYKEFLKKFAEKQMDAYESSWGWFFWNFKTERAPDWNYLLGLEHGWMPKLVSRRTYYC